MRKDPKSKSSRKVAFASLIGTAIEWYDFYLYGTSAALVFNKLFFPQFSQVAGTMSAFATLAIGFFARPLGGIIFGHFGDKISRKEMLIITILIMGISSFLIGLLPTYDQIGILAPILLVILRCLQGIGVGGEWGGAIVLTAEHSRDKERGFYSSWPNAGAPLGLAMALCAFMAVSSLPDEAFLTWGWRLPFIFGIALVLVGLFIRLKIMDSPIFSRQNMAEIAEIPAIDMVRTSPKNFLLAMGARFSESASYYIFSVFVLSYATMKLGVSRYVILYAVLLASLIETFTIVCFGKLSDKIGRRPVYMGGAILVGMFAFPFFRLLQSQNSYLIFLALIIGLSICHAAMHGAQAAFFSELFKTRNRYSGTAIAYHLSAALSGGLAPLFATWMVAWANNTWPVSLYMVIMSLITILSLFLSQETHQSSIK